MRSRIVVHAHPRPHRFDLDGFIQGLRGTLPRVAIETRPPLLESSGDEAHLTRLAATRVIDPFAAPIERTGCEGFELAAERGIRDGTRPPTGRPPPEGELYDGAQLAILARAMLPADERRHDVVHLVLTDRLFGTYQRSDARYHARVVLAMGPHLLSTAGLVEGPARPRGFYVAAQQGAAGIGPGALALEQALGDEIVRHGDARIPALMVGYALQAFMWQTHGEAFCPEPDCRLYNAHWQSEVIRAQREGPRFCPAHAALLAAAH